MVTSKYTTQTVCKHTAEPKKDEKIKYGKVVPVFIEWFWQDRLFMYQLFLYKACFLVFKSVSKSLRKVRFKLWSGNENQSLDAKVLTL
jgi:hypothetical protein